MRWKSGVSVIALATFSLASGGAVAQTANLTPAHVNILNLLSPYLSLNSTAIGRATLQSNLDSTVAVNNSSAARRGLASSDLNLFITAGSAYSPAGLTGYGAGANLAGGLPDQATVNGITPRQPVGGYGAVLGPIYQQGIAAGSKGPLASVNNLLVSTFVASGDSAVAKNYFANGAINNPAVPVGGYVPVPAVAPAGYTLPTANGLPNTTTSVYDLAYGVSNTQAGQDPYGSSRPYQTAPSRITLFNPLASIGTDTNPAFPSGHATYGFAYGTLLGMLLPQQFQSMVLRSTEYGESRSVVGVHYVLDVIGARVQSYYDLAQLLSNPAYINNAATTGTAVNLPSVFTAAQGDLQNYLSAQCGNTVAACASSAANTANNPYVPSDANQAINRARLTFGLPTLTFAQAPQEQAPAGAADASILLATIYGGSSAAAKTIAPNGGLYGQLSTGTINQILVNTETNALAAFYGSALSYWARLDLYTAAGYFGNVTGTLTMDATDRLLTGASIGSGGALYANGVIGGAAIVNSGGLLGGTGTVGGLSALSGGTVAPGAAGGTSIGSLSVAGNAAFASGSTYQVVANAAGQASRLAVSGTASLAGGTVQVLAQPGTYNPRTQYAILNAAGGVSGQFAGVTSNFAFLTPSLRYRPGEVDLTLTRNDIAFSSIATTRNGASVADAIQAGGPGTRIFGATVGLTTPEAQGAFRVLAGDIHGSAVSGSYGTAFFVREAILDRLRWGTTPGTADGLSFGSLPATYTADLPGRRPVVANVPVQTLDPTVVGLWGQGFGAFGDTSGRNAFGIDRTLAGFAAGLDVRLPSGIKLGVVGGYTDTTLDTRGRFQSADVTSGFGGVYGGYELGPVSVRLGAVYADESLKTRRTVIFPGVADTPSGRYGGYTVQGFGEIGYRIALGEAAPAALVSKDSLRVVPVQPATAYVEPFVGGSYTSIHRNAFAETGGVAALTGFARDYDVGAVTAGVRGQTSLDLGLGLPLTAHGLVGYRRAFGDVVPKALLSFGTGPAFLSAGTPIDRDAVVAEAGLDLRVAPNATLGIAYTGQAGSRAQDQAVKGNFTYKF